MKHPDDVKKVLKRAGLSMASELDADQLGRAKAIASADELEAQGTKSKYPRLKGPALANFILKGGKGAGGKAAGRGRVPGKMSMTEAAAVVLGSAKGPLHAKEVYKRAERRKLIATKGKTPEQTMAARLAVGTRNGRFERTAPNTFTLPEAKKPKGRGRKDPKRPVPAAA